MAENIPIDEELVEIAMSMITEAGEARVNIGHAITAIENNSFDAAKEHLETARKLIGKAHGMQTEIVQSEGELGVRQHPLLFIHAQDTLMTINSELNLVRRLMKVFANLDERLRQLEK
jgi:PTS system cellobiose-specific IIA component